MSTLPTKNTLPNTKPKYAQINLYSSQFQGTRDTQIPQKLFYISHNDEDLEHLSKQNTPSYKLVCKNIQ